MKGKFFGVEKTCECGEKIAFHWMGDFDDYWLVRCHDCGHEGLVSYGNIGVVEKWIRSKVPSLGVVGEIRIESILIATERILEKCACGGRYTFMNDASPAECPKCGEFVFFGDVKRTMTAEDYKKEYPVVDLPEVGFLPKTVKIESAEERKERKAKECRNLKIFNVLTTSVGPDAHSPKVTAFCKLLLAVEEKENRELWKSMGQHAVDLSLIANPRNLICPFFESKKLLECPVYESGPADVNLKYVVPPKE